MNATGGTAINVSAGTARCRTSVGRKYQSPTVNNTNRTIRTTKIVAAGSCVAMMHTDVSLASVSSAIGS